MDKNSPLMEKFEMKVQSADKQEKTLTCVIVSGKTNRGRRKIDVKGCQSEDYMKSPVVLAFHDDERVIARCLWLKVQNEGIVAKFEFRDSDLANDIFSLYKEGFLTSWSIGFLPQSWNYEEEDGTEIIHITKWTLLEVSAVSIPMDANAVTLAIGQGIVHDSFLIQSIKQFNEKTSIEALNDTVMETFKIVKELQNGLERIQAVNAKLEDIKSKFAGIEEKLEKVDSKIDVNEHNTIEIVDMSDFTKEINEQLKNHIGKIKGKV